MVAPFTQPVAFLGIKPLYLRTYTDTYAPIGGGAVGTDWTMIPNSIQPMDFQSYGGSAGAGGARPLVGFKARLFDINTGYTTITAGDQSGYPISFAGSFPFVYDGQSRIKGFAVGLGDVHDVVPICDLYCPMDGAARVYSNMGLGGAWPYNNGGGQMPYPGQGCNWLTYNGGVYSSAVHGFLQNEYFVFNGIASTLVDDTSIGGNLGRTDARFSDMARTAQANFIMCADNVGGTVPYNMVQTDFTSYFQPITLSVQNPPASDIDFNTLFTQAGYCNFLRATRNSWLGFQTNTIHVGSKTLNGWGFEMNVDGSGYWLIEIIPQDAIAINWASAGNVQAQTDARGTVWMKKVVFGQYLFAGSNFPSNGNAQPVPQKPPVNLPVNPGLYR